MSRGSRLRTNPGRPLTCLTVNLKGTCPLVLLFHPQLTCVSRAQSRRGLVAELSIQGRTLFPVSEKGGQASWGQPWKAQSRAVRV